MKGVTNVGAVFSKRSIHYDRIFYAGTRGANWQRPDIGHCVFRLLQFFLSAGARKELNEIEGERAAFARSVAEDLAPRVAEEVASSVRKALSPRRSDY